MLRLSEKMLTYNEFSLQCAFGVCPVCLHSKGLCEVRSVVLSIAVRHQLTWVAINVRPS